MRKINSLTDFLMAIKNNELQPDFSGDEFYRYGPIMITDDLINNYAQLSLNLGLVIGLQTTIFDHQVPGIFVESPILTPKGEQYLRDQNLLKKYPLLEKILLVILTGIVSALTTLGVQFLTN